MMSASTYGDIKLDDGFHIVMGCSVVSPQIVHDLANIHVEMKEAGKEGIRFVTINFRLN